MVQLKGFYSKTVLGLAFVELGDYLILGVECDGVVLVE